jgi:hypothetical protein
VIKLLVFHNHCNSTFPTEANQKQLRGMKIKRWLSRVGKEQNRKSHRCYNNLIDKTSIASVPCYLAGSRAAKLLKVLHPILGLIGKQSKALQALRS